eukprot:1160461-Pelagomonas_calceolata.AAC.1
MSPWDVLRTYNDMPHLLGDCKEAKLCLNASLAPALHAKWVPFDTGLQGLNRQGAFLMTRMDSGSELRGRYKGAWQQTLQVQSNGSRWKGKSGAT